ncbi:EAL and modified HD-GYP domain-containing signal transduction protein [Desulfobaculum xiamenense]|uniref:EAL and modified HD-GYP domain-containing signal transduction protein n=1 Tax=Desulfobaculum xiamenense TaxID=995050 RepID=A0A846QPK9_9BACT|nr:HDOD domain-containing protein [Desulfobaculum xiamenense]NJB68253.1 EAL and modified HD-GYP domain-containing signal transduction protein [Desulfobaculum xiamenense]
MPSKCNERDEITSAAESVFVARQPIFDVQQNVFGYELLFRSSGEAACAFVTDSDMATTKVIADGFLLAHAGMEPGQRALINFPRRLLLDDAAFALPPDIAIVEILEDVRPEPDVLHAIQAIKQSGFMLAMDDYMGEPELEPFLQFVDIIKVDILGLGGDPERIRQTVEKLAKYGCTLLAEKVEDLETFELTKELGFTLFQGFFFSKPEIIPGKKISSSEIAKLQLLQELGRPDFEVAKIGRIIQSDLSLSYRLFQYINSAGLGVRYKVDSVSRALTLLGQRQLAQWLRVAIMSDLSPSRKAAEVAFLSVHRGRFLEMLEGVAKSYGVSPDSMFLLGLFSLLDALLGQPMDVVLKNVPLDDEVYAALVGQDNRLKHLLDLSRAYEHGHWDYVREAVHSVGLTQEHADRCFVQAMAWTQDILGRGREEC